MDINVFLKLWKNENTNKEAIEIFWDNRAEEFNKKENFANDIVNFLLNNKMIDKNSKILDIGCGPGKYSIKFAKLCNQVVAIDISNKMLKFAEYNATKNNIYNIEFKKSFWDNIDLKENNLENKFDLVFASMCPGINDYETLNKMIKASKKYCFMSGFVKRDNFLWNKLNQYLKKDNINKNIDKKIYCAFNILYLKGYYPQIKYINKDWENVYPLDYLANQYITYLEMKEKLTNKDKEKIYNYLNKVSENGYVKENINSKIAWIYWKVN
ncbi:class I SAM-dependent methyltransferase [Tepidibacter thalassicus]|uniref:Methyltransferase domain-containing protein n=1 Tax=Tepidibacter thalassicus DSM 15285 TaxID=1123350 RepID=A0A1M5P209_9FIRM|nr:class I SAM-dependent methyltransferase [Tepidibacter thalassicus]SHG95830.1 Methyltransferase domain-containing protein [Tepidibacter thalassicus DSM 15285]